MTKTPYCGPPSGIGRWPLHIYKRCRITSYTGPPSSIGRYGQKSLYRTPPPVLGDMTKTPYTGPPSGIASWPLHIWELAKLGAPPPRPFLFYSIFSICHFIGKSGVFLNARTICYAKTTFLSDKTSCTVSGNFFKRKNVVLGRVLACFSYTNQGQGDLDLHRKNRLKLVPKHEFSLKKFSRYCTARFIR